MAYDASPAEDLKAKALEVHDRLCREYGCPIEFFHDFDPLSELVSSLLSHRTRNADSGRAFIVLDEDEFSKTLIPELIRLLHEAGRTDIRVIAGGVIPPQDFDALYAAGASAIFPPGTVIADAAEKLIAELNERLGYASRAAAE